LWILSGLLRKEQEYNHFLPVIPPPASPPPLHFRPAPSAVLDGTTPIRSDQGNDSKCRSRGGGLIKFSSPDMQGIESVSFHHHYSAGTYLRKHIQIEMFLHKTDGKSLQ
jgi:hypothetical protein